MAFFFDILGDVPRVNGQRVVACAFGDRSLKQHLSSEPDVRDTEFLILASDGLWKARHFFQSFTYLHSYCYMHIFFSQTHLMGESI